MANSAATSAASAIVSTGNQSRMARTASWAGVRVGTTSGLPRPGGPAPAAALCACAESPHSPACCWSASSLCSTGQWARASAQRTARAVSGCPLLRPSLPSELLLNRRRHEVHEDDVVRHAVEPDATVKLLRDAGRQLGPGFFGRGHLCRLALRSPRPAWTTPATAAPVLCSLRGGDAPEQRLDRSADFLLHQVADHRHQALLSRHRLLRSGGRYTNVRSPAKAMRQAFTEKMAQSRALMVAESRRRRA